MIQVHFPICGTMALVAVRSFISSGFNINLPLTPGFESGFSGFTGLQRTSSIWLLCLSVDAYLILFFSPMRNASARGFDMKAPTNNNLPSQTGDVIINPENPENPDSNHTLLRPEFPTKIGEVVVFWECFL